MCGNTRRIFARVAKLREPAKYNETFYIVRLGANTKSHTPLVEIIKSLAVIGLATYTRFRQIARVLRASDNYVFTTVKTKRWIIECGLLDRMEVVIAQQQGVRFKVSDTL